MRKYYSSVKYLISLAGVIGFIFHQMLKSPANEYGNSDAAFLNARLRELAARFDVNGDEKISLTELLNWYNMVESRDKADELKQIWEMVEMNNDGVVTLEEYLSQMGLIFEGDQMFNTRSKKRFSIADRDGSGSLNIQEFALFIFPELSPESLPMIYDEEMLERDRDGDGELTLPEYLGIVEAELEEYLYDDQMQENILYFNTYLDANKDTVLDDSEIRAWLRDVHHSYRSKALALITEVDEDLDQQLDIQSEILPNLEYFMEMDLTKQGDLLYYDHDEL